MVTEKEYKWYKGSGTLHAPFRPDERNLDFLIKRNESLTLNIDKKKNVGMNMIMVLCQNHFLRGRTTVGMEMIVIYSQNHFLRGRASIVFH